mmetsp:Transcript_55359/g.130672  ORF Transcript_55359/g.130672 Transcript_55359/m.130672 type:complete len:259 (-) Transcript_55359:32-808(-)
MVEAQVKQDFLENLRPFGLTAGFCRVGAYNDHSLIRASPALRIRDPVTGTEFAPDRMMAVVVNFKDVWEPFLSWLSREGPSLDSECNPLEAYSARAVDEATTSTCSRTKIDKLLTWGDTQTRPFCIIMQAAAHIAGIATYEPSLMWSVHKEHGLWLGYRAVVIFDVGSTEQHDPSPVLTQEQRSAIKELQDEVSAALDAGGNPDQVNYFQQRDVYPVGAHARYTAEMIRYFHGASPEGRRETLKRALRRRGLPLPEEL